MNKTEITPEQAILEIRAEWDVYEKCRNRALLANKGSQTIRKLFERETGILLPFLCIWKTQDEMIERYGGHNLEIDSLHDAMAHCKCGWSIACTGERTAKELRAEYQKHIK